MGMKLEQADVEDRIQGSGDKEGLFTNKKYQGEREASVVIADGAHVVDVGGGKAVNIDEFVSFVTTSEEGPKIPHKGGPGSRGWHWVDSEHVQTVLHDIHVSTHFDMHLFKPKDGRQVGAVDAKIQGLLRRTLTVSKRTGITKVTLVLMASDGDHAGHLWQGVASLLRKKVKVVVWIIGWSSASVSSQLRRVPTDVIPDMKRLVLNVRFFGSRGNGKFCEPRSIGLTDRIVDNITPQTPTLRSYVDMIFPLYCPSFTSLLRNKGLQDLLDAVWHATEVPSDQPTFLGNVMIVSGETGSGKSTQLPQLIYDQLCYKKWKTTVHGKPFQRARVLCTQPRRIACTSVSEFVRQDRITRQLPWDTVPENTVGYHIGGVRAVPDAAGIVYCTAGVLLKQLLHSNDEGWDVVMLDEIHERSVEYDLLLALLLRKDYLDSGKVVIIMSATLGGMAEKFLEYAEQRCSWFETKCFKQYNITADPEEHIALTTQSNAFNAYIPKKRTRFRVDVFYLEQMLDEMCSTHGDRNQILSGGWIRERFIKKFLNRKLKEAGGKDTFLVFLPGMSLIQDFQKYIENTCPGVRVSTLHSMMTDEQQAATLERHPSEGVRVILSTDIAESSLTIEDATVVMDMCLRKEAKCCGRSRKQLDYILTTKDTCTQRKGRVGRVADGVCYRMVSREEWSKMKEAKTPDIIRRNLELIVLDVLSKAQTEDPLLLIRECISSPPEGQVNNAVRELQNMCAITTPKRGEVPRLESFGKLLHSMPCDLEVAKFVIWSSLVSHDLGKLAVIFAAMFEANAVRDMMTETSWLEICSRAVLHKNASLGYSSDVVVLIRLYLEYKARNPGRNHDSSFAWCRARGIDPKSIRAARRKIAQIRHKLHKFRPVMPELPEELMQQGNGVMRLNDILESLDKEEIQQKRGDYEILMFIHASCFVGNAVMCSPITSNTLPKRCIEIKLRTTGDADYKTADRNKRKVLDKLFKSHGAPVSGVVTYCKPDRDKIGANLVAHVRVLPLSKESDPNSFPTSVYLASLIDSRHVRNLFKFSTSVTVTVPHYGHKLLSSDDETSVMNALQNTFLKPLLLPENNIEPGKLFALFPSTVEDHEKIYDKDKYTRMNGVATALPNNIVTESGVPLWKLILHIFGDEKEKLDEECLHDLDMHITTLQKDLVRATLVNTDSHLQQIEDEEDDGPLEEELDGSWAFAKTVTSFRANRPQGDSNSRTCTFPSALFNCIKDLLTYVAHRRGTQPSVAAVEAMFMAQA